MNKQHREKEKEEGQEHHHHQMDGQDIHHQGEWRRE